VVPQRYDQPYWARRVQELGLGVAHGQAALSADSLTGALTTVLAPATAERARSVASQVRRDGARVAAERLMALA